MVGNFATFNWDFREVDGEKQCRPIFLISDSFVKEHNMQVPKTRHSPTLAKAEDINYSKLAIKFSKTLTKDMIFSGLRDILHKIGEYVDRSYEFEIEFSFGLLLSKEKRIRFDFNFLRLTQILPENMVGEARAQQMGLTKPIKSKSVGSSTGQSRPSTSSGMYPRRTPTTIGTKLPKMTETNPSLSMDLSLNFDTIRANSTVEQDATLKSTTSDVNIGQEGATFSSLGIDLGFGDKQASSQRPISPGMQELLRSMDPPSPLLSKKERQALACQSVSDQAFRRCLFNVQQDVRGDEYKDIAIAKLEHDKEIQELKLRQLQKQQVKVMQQTLNDQIEKKKLALAKPKTPSATSLQLEPTPAMEKEKEDQKHELLKFLNQQIESKRLNKEREKYAKLSEESRFLEHVAAEFDVQNTEDRVRHLEKQRALLEDWERAAHIRNLKKLKGGSHVVNKYVTTNFSGHTGPVDATYVPETNSRGSTRGFEMSVGFDSRR